MSTRDEMINEITRLFNWDRVKKVMDALDWRWGHEKEIPTTGQIIVTATELLRECYDKGVKYGYYCISSGGFTATYQESYLMLEYIVEVWDTYKEEQ